MRKGLYSFIGLSIITLLITGCADLPKKPPDPSVTGQLSISGTPRTEAYFGYGYQFKPKITRVNVDDRLTFIIENRPPWLTFDTTTGQLSGFPIESDRGKNTDLRLAVTDGRTTKSLQPFTIEVTKWNGFGYCSGRNSNGDVLCTPISKEYVVDSQCEFWGEMQRLANPVLHIYDKLSTLQTNAKAVCTVPPPILGKKCPKGYISVRQDLQPPAPTTVCMPKIPPAEIARGIGQQITQDISNYLEDAETHTLPDFTPLEPELEGPDADGLYEVTIPPPVVQQIELEKQRRSQTFGPALNRMAPTGCPGENGSQWNKAACFDWGDNYGNNTIGASISVKGYMKLSGEAAASATLTGKLVGMSKEIVRMSMQTSVKAAPDSYVKSPKTVQDIIKEVKGAAPQQDLEGMLRNSPTLRGQSIQADAGVVELVRNAKIEFDNAKAAAEASISSTLAEIEQAKARLMQAEKKLDEAVMAFDASQASAENRLPSLQVESSSFAGSLQVFTAQGMREVWTQNQSAQGNNSLRFNPPGFNQNYTLFKQIYPFSCGVPCYIELGLAIDISLEPKISIDNPLQAESASVVFGIQPSAGVSANGFGGVGIPKVASLGVEGTINVIRPILNFSLSAKAVEFPKKPLVVVGMQGNMLSGRIAAVGKVEEVVQVVIEIANAPAKAINWLGEQLGAKKKIIPEIRLKGFNETLFKFAGFNIPEPNSQPDVINRFDILPGSLRNWFILECSRREECYANRTVLWTPPPQVFTLNISRSGAGTITGPGINCGNDCSENYNNGSVISLKATPSSGWNFDSWTGDCSGGVSVHMNANRHCHANFFELPRPPNPPTRGTGSFDPKKLTRTCWIFQGCFWE